MARARLLEVVLDCADPAQLAEFWGALFEVEPKVRESGTWAEVHAEIVIAFQQVPESKVVKNRVHLDVLVDDIPSETARCVALGATQIGSIVTDPISDFQVLQDPEGNEFCLVAT